MLGGKKLFLGQMENMLREKPDIPKGGRKKDLCNLPAAKYAEVIVSNM